MARLQILELPEGSGDDRPPFILVIDQATEDIAKTLAPTDGEGVSYATAIQRLTGLSLAEQIGARAILVFEETIDIPANDVPLDADGNPLFLKMHIEGDFEQFREQVQDEIAKAQAAMRQAINES